MKWYKHDPSAFLAGVFELTPEERGAYITLIDLQYARHPHGTVSDDLVMKALGVGARRWQRLKASLTAKGKLVDNNGVLTARKVVEVTSDFDAITVRRAYLRGRNLKKQTLRLITNVTEEPEPE